MASSNGASVVTGGDAKNSLDKIKRQLSSASGKNLLQGPLLKRSETLRKWNERWVILDPTTGKMEYKMKRNEVTVRGKIEFDSDSTITISPLNFHGDPKYDGCCFYIGNPQKKEYFLCAETKGATRAWVSTLHATQLVLRAHKEAVNSLSGSSSSRLGTVATVVAAANSSALEASKEIEAAMRISMRAALGLMAKKQNEGQLDDLTIMKETLRVKDEELHHLARDLRARDATIKEIAEKLTDTAEAAESAASAAHAMDEERRIGCAEIERLTKEKGEQVESLLQKLRESDELVNNLNKERDQLLKERDSALQEAHLWRSELAKAREGVVILEAAVLRAEERVRVVAADAEIKLKDAAEKASTSSKQMEELRKYVNMLELQIQRKEDNTKEVINETSESSMVTESSYLLTKHVDSEDDVDKACLSDPRFIRSPTDGETDGEVQLPVDRVDIPSIGDSGWSSFQSPDARIADVREISPEQARSLDIAVVSQAVQHDQPGGSPRQS